MPRLAVTATVALLLPLAPSASLADAPLAFSAPVLVDGTDGSGEPGVKVDGFGHIYINSLSALHDTIHVSVDGGATFAPIHTTNAVFGGGDDALAVDRFGGLYMAGQYSYANVGCQSMSTSLDKGATWVTTLVPCRGGADGQLGAPTDRPWVAVYRPEATSVPTILMVHHAPCCGGDHWAVRSTDGGVTFRVAGLVSEQGWFPGNLLIDEPRRIAYAFYSCDAGVCMARSDDLGATWTERVVAAEWGPGLHRVVGAIDTAGNLYVVWSANWYAPSIRMAISTVGGISWSAPKTVSTTTGTHIMPWIVAGDPGRVNVVWYETSVVGNPDSPTDMRLSTTNWDVKFAQSLNALAPSPTWEEVKVTPKPHHRGVLCTSGVWCNTHGRNRNLLDFFEVALDAQGFAHIVYATDFNQPGTLRVETTVDAFQRQVGGSSLLV